MPNALTTITGAHPALGSLRPDPTPIGARPHRAALGLAIVGLLAGCGDDGGPSLDETDGDDAETTADTDTSAADTAADTSADTSADEGDSTTGDDGSGPIDGYPALDAPCAFGVSEPATLAVSSTDDATGAVGLVDVATKQIRRDLALAQSDIGLSAHGSHLFVINRFGFDFVDVLDRDDDLALVSEFSVAIDEDRSSNPHDLIVTENDEAYVSLFGDDQIQVFDLSDPGDPKPLRTVDLAAFADADGLPEMGKLVACGDVAFVAVERLDRDASWASVDGTHLVPFALGSDRFYEWDAAHPGADEVDLLGLGAKALRADPRETGGHVGLLLSSGLERVDFAAGSSEWVISDAIFEAAGIGRYQLRDFDVGGDGNAYFAVATSDFSEHQIWRASLDGEGQDLEMVVSGLQTVTGSMEIVGDVLWFADTTIGSSGLRVFDIGAATVVEVGTPISTGLPPYGLLALP